MEVLQSIADIYRQSLAHLLTTACGERRKSPSCTTLGEVKCVAHTHTSTRRTTLHESCPLQAARRGRVRERESERESESERECESKGRRKRKRE